jgi:hypothetical protein
MLEVISYRFKKIPTQLSKVDENLRSHFTDSF